MSIQDEINTDFDSIFDCNQKKLDSTTKEINLIYDNLILEQTNVDDNIVLYYIFICTLVCYNYIINLCNTIIFLHIQLGLKNNFKIKTLKV